MKKFFILFIAMIGLQWSGIAQVDSIHFQFQDTLLKAGTSHTFLMTVREDLKDMEGFQFCIGFDPANIEFVKVGNIYVPDWDPSNIFPYPQGNNNMISSILDFVLTPYSGKELVEFDFNVINDCRVKDVIQVLSAYRYKPSDSYFYSEVYLTTGTSPIATEYLPFETTSSIAPDNIVSLSTAYPNPSKTGVYFDFSSMNAGQSKLIINDISGKVVHTEDVNVHVGINTLYFDRNKFGPAGSYILSLKAGNQYFNNMITVID